MSASGGNLLRRNTRRENKVHISTDGIVLREKQIEDYDSILTLLTRARGVITAYARGARKPRNALRVSAELLSYSDFVLFSSKDRYSVDKSALNRLFMGVRGDIEKLSLASYFCQLAAEAAPREEPADDYLRLLLNCLHLLDTGKRTGTFLKPVFELRLLTIAGFMPHLVGCAACGTFEAPRMFFLPQPATLLCENCMDHAGKDAVLLPVEPGVLTAMRHTIYSDNVNIFSFTLSEAGLDRLGEITELYVMHQLEKRFETLEFYKSIR